MCLLFTADLIVTCSLYCMSNDALFDSDALHCCAIANNPGTESF